MTHIHKIETSELIHDYLEYYMDIARLELALLMPEYYHPEHVSDRLDGNKDIVKVIARELASRGDTSLFDRHDLVLGGFSM